MIPLKIHPFFWLFASLIGFLNSSEPMQIVIWVLVIFFSLLVHEYGHALMAKAFQQTARIEFFAFGGVTYREGRKLKLWEEFLVVVAGPCAGFLLCILGYFILPHITDKQSLLFFFVSITTIVNLLWTVLNLIPVLPLDGGQLLRIILEKFMGYKAIRVTHLISLILAIALTFLFFVEGQIFLGVLFFMLAFMSYRSFKESSFISAQDQDTELQKLFEEAEQQLLLGNKQDALARFKKVRSGTSHGVIYNIATETAALILLEDASKDPAKKEEAYKYLQSLPMVSPEITPRFHELAFEFGNYTKTIDLAEEAFQLQPTAQTAFITARACAALKQVEASVGWLECALSEGLANFEQLLQSKEFDPIRETAEFKSFLQELEG